LILAALDLHTIAQYSALRIVESLAEGIVIFGFVAVLLRIVPRQNAGTRFAICFSALIAIALAPVVTGVWSSQIAGSAPHLIHPAITVPDSWAVYLFVAWALLAAWFLMGIARALLRLRSLKRSCDPVDVSTLDPAVQNILQVGGENRALKLCTSEQVRVPTAIGLTRPMVVLPSWVLQELTTSELRLVLIHEVAHLRRGDDWTNLVQQVVKALFFFHPAVWWIEKNVALEREIACDDAVLAETESPRSYAECLAHLAERSFLRRSIALAQAALGKVRQTSDRVAQILDGNRPRGTRTWKPAVSLVAGFAIVFSIGASRFQRLIAFESDSAAQIADSTGPVVPAAADASYVHKAAFYPSELAKSTRPKQSKSPTEPVQRHSSTNRRAARPQVVKPTRDPMMHLASWNRSTAPLQETVVLFVQGSDHSSDDGLYRVQMWRVTVLHYVVSASGTAPRKQT